MPKVLVVEDEPSIVTIVRYHLESAGFEGLFAADAEEGWRLLTNEHPDAAVVDIKLPGADGWTLIARARAEDAYRQLPVVVLTGLLEPDVLRRAEELGCEYLSKPFAATALLGRLRDMLSGTAAPAPAPAMDGEGPRTRPVPVVVSLLLDEYQVDGTVYLSPGPARFSDAWESLVGDARSFFPVTDAAVYPAGGGHAFAHPAFIEVRKEDVRAVFPKDVQPE
jgi:CheY-like chemotaxis protein